VSVGAHVFKGDLDAQCCAACGETLVDQATLEQFELRIAYLLARAGEVTGESFRFMRKTLGLSGRAIGEELGVPAETISRWERGEEHGGRPVDRFAWLALASLVEDKIAGRTAARSLLRAMRERPGLAKTVRVDMGEAFPADA
jgi:DNA-binding transcriptional regulator YiaG